MISPDGDNSQIDSGRDFRYVGIDLVALQKSPPGIYRIDLHRVAQVNFVVDDICRMTII